MKTEKSRTLNALTSAALAIPAAAVSTNAIADAPPTMTEVGYRYSQYQEDDIAESDKVEDVGSTQRYDINIHQFRVLTPVGDNYSVDATFDYETMSGASPLGTIQGADGDPLLVMSGASIDDTRIDLNVKTTRYYENGNASIIGGYSTEDDYEAFNLGLEGEKHINDKLTTLMGGIGYSDDTIEPTPAPGRVTEEEKYTATTFVGIAQVINAESVLQTSINYAYSDGYLSDPYKLVDQRPDSRSSIAWNTRYRHYLGSLDAAVHADYRLYVDDWDMVSHTVGIEWHQNIDPNLRVIPSFRYYSQSQADFYKPIDVVGIEGDKSSDYRLSPFGAVTFGLSAVAHSYNWKIIVSAERYIADGDLALGTVETEHPGLLQYTLLTVGFDYAF